MNKLTSPLGLPGRERLLLPNYMYDSAVKYGDVNILQNRELREALRLLPAIAGGSQPLSGIHTEGDVITQTADGIDTNLLWQEFQRVLELRNAQRQPIVDLLTYTVPKPIESVPQAGNANLFEEASEFGVPVAQRTGVSYFQMGFSFKWYDTGLRYTWKYLAEAEAEQVRSDTVAVIESDNRLVFNEVMKTLFRNTNRTANIQNKDYTVFALYNGDGTVPPDYKTNTFAGTHTHYLSSGANAIVSADLDNVTNHLDHHGYNSANGYTLVVLVNKVEGDAIRNFRAPLNGGTAKFDFIPALGTPNFLLPTNLITINQNVQRPQDTYRGIKVIGIYGDLLILQDDFMPAGYIAAFATGGPENIANPIGIREHSRTDLRGLRLVKGRSPDYPLQEAYYQRGFGTGIRHRGAGVVMRISTAAYAAPAQYA